MTEKTAIIILAAGENTRLQAAGIAPGKKPLMVIDGEVLIRRTVRVLREQAGNADEPIIIVASPGNRLDVGAAVDGMDKNVMIPLQHEATGPQKAVDVAMSVMPFECDRIMLIMADNWIPEDILSRRFVGSARVASVVHTSDRALLPFSDLGFIAPVPHDVSGSAARWLGPLWFPHEDWRMGNGTWQGAFHGILWDQVEGDGVLDLGTPEGLRAKQGLTIKQFFKDCQDRQEGVNGQTIEQMPVERRGINAHDNAYAAIREICEALDEMRWKSWGAHRGALKAGSTPTDRGHEIADILLFVANLASYLLYDVPKDERSAMIERAIIEKSAIVDQRFAENDPR